jgi:transposase-like protein
MAPLRLRLVKEMLVEREAVVSYETIRHRGRKFDRTMPDTGSLGPDKAKLFFSSWRDLNGDLD